MFHSQVVALIAFLGACQAAEHAYSSQSIVHHGLEEHHGLGDYQGHEEHKDHEEHHGHEIHHEHEIYHEHKVQHGSNDHSHQKHKTELKSENHENEHKIPLEFETKQKVEHTVEHEHHVEHKVEHHVEHKVEHKKESKVEPKKVEKHEQHVKIIPVVQKIEEAYVVAAPVKVVPIAHYVKNAQKKEGSHEEHKPAISSQHISRHDVPAQPPKDFDDQSTVRPNN